MWVIFTVISLLLYFYNGISNFLVGLLLWARNNVFHILSNAENLYGKKYWFAMTIHTKATLLVVNYEEILLEKLPKLSKRELYFQFHVLLVALSDNDWEEWNTWRCSVIFLVTEIFKDLTKVIVMDYDVVIQRGITFLWNLDMGTR